MKDSAPLNGFDFIAPFYDTLARLVYGKSIIASQTVNLHLVPRNANVLILGGGTGWIIEKLLLIQPDCTIWYVEASQKMILYAKKKAGSHRVNFIHGTLDQIEAPLLFDVVITNFFLDLFKNDSVEKIAGEIKLKMNRNALWLVADFINGEIWWQKMLLSFMYIFFRITGGLKTTNLPYWNETIVKYGFKQLNSTFYYKSFIQSICFQLPAN